MVKRSEDMYIGAQFPTTSGGNVVVLEYINSKRVLVKFINTGSEVWTRTVHIRSGLIKDKLSPRLQGVGYIGTGPYSPTHYNSVKGVWENTFHYNRFGGMIYRCYNPKSYETYKDSFVEEKWHNFQTFAGWVDSEWKEEYRVSGIQFELDKDLLVKGNKVYSESTCCLIPKEVNMTLVKGDKHRGSSLIGTSLTKKGRFRARGYFNGVAIELGLFDEEHLAFEAYKKNKKRETDRLVEKYRGFLRDDVIQALSEYKIDKGD
ncbi:putative homing endonuclease HNH [Vibrio phage 496E54-1]|nr:putative homing endonuclease HNH [Vibrio phage 496E54-1]